MNGIAFYNVIIPSIKEDIDLFKEEITRILLTSKGERPNNPEFGSNLKSYIFGVDIIVSEEIEGEIRSSLARWMPYIIINNVYASKTDERSLYVRISLETTDTFENFDYETLITI